MNHFVLLIRSIIFYIGFTLITVIIATNAILIGWFLPLKWRFIITANLFGKTAILWLRICCNLRFEIRGLEHIPQEPCIIASKHQSSWETYLLQSLFSPVVTILKRELLYIPFFGWALARIKPIAINRSDGKTSIEQLVEQGRMRLQEKLWVLVFPEGTRIDVGQYKPYAKGGSVLAYETGYPILPIAHNAGLFWPAHQLIKYPGTITISIGPVINPKGKEVPQITQALEDWIEPTVKQLVSEARTQHPYLPSEKINSKPKDNPSS